MGKKKFFYGFGCLEGGKPVKRRQFIQGLTAGSLAVISQSGLRGEHNGALQIEVTQRRPDFRLEPVVKESFSNRDARIEVDLDNIIWNYGQIKKRVKVPVMAVVKANAYGHGLVNVSKILEGAGVHGLMVGKLQEAVALRNGGVRCQILNFGPFDRRDCEEIVGREISQSVYTEEARFLEEAAVKLKKKASVHIDVDTGMCRTGISHAQAFPLMEKISSLPHIKIEGVSTTLTEDPDFDREQLTRFLAVCDTADKKGISLGLRHAASSDGLFRPARFHLDMVRPGIMLYGYYPNARTQKEDAWGLKPALLLEARVVFIKDLESGESLSYLRAFVAQKKMRVATVGIGYSDGYLPQLGGKAAVSIRDKTYPVLDAVTSNHIMVDLNNDPEVQVDDRVTLIHPEAKSGLTADRLAESAGISDYKLLIGLSGLLPRTFLKNS